MYLILIFDLLEMNTSEQLNSFFLARTLLSTLPRSPDYSLTLRPFKMRSSQIKCWTHSFLTIRLRTNEQRYRSFLPGSRVCAGLVFVHLLTRFEYNSFVVSWILLIDASSSEKFFRATTMTERLSWSIVTSSFCKSMTISCKNIRTLSGNEIPPKATLRTEANDLALA